MSPASLLTGVAAGLEFPARIGAPFVDAAGDALANGSGQGGAANRQVVGAAHAAAGTVDFNAQSVWDATPLREQLTDRKVHSKTGAAGAACGARVVGHAVCVRFSV